MDAKRILNYLKQLMTNNNREWYWANKAEYDAIINSVIDDYE